MRNCVMAFLISSLILFSSCSELTPAEKRKEAQEIAKKNPVIKKQENKLILFFGNSLTAGYGLKPKEAFPALIQQRIDSMGLAYEVLNAGLVEETSAEGRKRINWLLNQDVDVFVMELGINDWQAGIPLEETQENLQAILDTVRSRNPHTTILLTGVETLPTQSNPKDTDFHEIYTELASEYEVALVPCVMEDIEGVPSLLQERSLYPTAQGHEIVAHNVWKVLRPLLISQGTLSSQYSKP